WIAANIMKGSGFGLLVNIIVGIIGAVLGGWIFSLFGVQETNIIGQLISAVVGSVVLLWIISLFKRT
ncbi:MAG: GlsB/YeaQ/YmgE family stress response membrane protein, partial [Bacteroidales bacterium]|nr:GlsB/YeaQ/YmgE family stress response membrane protein [Bacteroidales bacterium]